MQAGITFFSKILTSFHLYWHGRLTDYPAGFPALPLMWQQDTPPDSACRDLQCDPVALDPAA